MALTTRQIFLMGTIITLQVDCDDPQTVLDELVRRLHIYNHRFSANDDNSELMQIMHNAGKKPVPVNSELYDLIKLGKKYSLEIDSNFNIAIGPLVQLWRIGFSDAKVPSETEIKQALTLTGPQNIELNDHAHSVYLTKPKMAIDLGSIAKGYITDLLVNYLKEAKVQSALINLGGNVYAYGPSSHQDHKWRIGIQNPKLPRGNYCDVIKVENQSVVTSGIYERELIVNGKKYHHILDKHTGHPVTSNIASVTVVANKSTTCDLWTEILFGQPVDKIIKILNSRRDINGIVITQDDKMYSTIK